MKHFQKGIIFFALILVFNCIAISSVLAEGFTSVTKVQNSASWQRISGETRYATAKAIAEQFNNDKVDNVVLASGNDYPDALSVSALAYQLKAPILLANQSYANSPDAVDYIKTHLKKGGKIYLIGGEVAIKSDFESNLPDFKFQRLGGATRFETNLLINTALAAKKGTPVFIASGDDFPDALSASSIAAAKGFPILLVSGNSLSEAQKNYLAQLKPSAIYFMGGYAVTSYSIQKEIMSMFPSTTILRWGGKDRFETAKLLFNAFELTPKTLYLSSGYDFADALSGSILAARNEDPILILDNNAIEPPYGADDYINALYNKGEKPDVVALGGLRVLTDKLIDTVKNHLETGNISASLQAYRAMKNTDFADLRWYSPSILKDIKYATANNFTGTVLYDSSAVLLRKGTADKLNAVEDELEKKGLRIRIWDAYRSPAAQFKMWSIVPNANWVANPYKGYSNHSRGTAVDITLTDFDGNELVMPTGFDDFSSRADRNYSDVSNTEADNALLLEGLMKDHGFIPYQGEWWHFDDSDTPDYDVPQAASGYSIPIPKPLDKQTIVFSSVGDCTLGTDPRYADQGSFPQTYDQNGANYFFSGVEDILGADDLTLANLETTLTNETARIDKSNQSRPFWFSGDPSYVNILKSGSVDIVNVANNHSLDLQETGFYDTVNNLTDAGVAYTGYGHSSILTQKGIRFGFLGYNAIGKIEQGVDLDNLKQQMASEISALKKDAQVIIISIHWGEENSYTPNSLQTELAHYAIDQGADLVVGHHPHVLQPIEEYHGKYIAYSLGNFSFGGNFNPWDKDTIIFQANYQVVNGQFWGLSGIKVIPARISTSTERNDYRPVEVGGEDYNRILHKVGM